MREPAFDANQRTTIRFNVIHLHSPIFSRRFMKLGINPPWRRLNSCGAADNTVPFPEDLVPRESDGRQSNFLFPYRDPVNRKHDSRIRLRWHLFVFVASCLAFCRDLPELICAHTAQARSPGAGRDSQELRRARQLRVRRNLQGVGLNWHRLQQVWSVRPHRIALARQCFPRPPSPMAPDCAPTASRRNSRQRARSQPAATLRDLAAARPARARIQGSAAVPLVSCPAVSDASPGERRNETSC